MNFIFADLLHKLCPENKEEPIKLTNDQEYILRGNVVWIYAIPIVMLM